MNIERTFTPEDEPECLLVLGQFLRHALVRAMRERGVVQRQVAEALGIEVWAWTRFIAADRATVGDLQRAFETTGHDLRVSTGGDEAKPSVLLIDMVGSALTEGDSLRVMVQSG